MTTDPQENEPFITLLELQELGLKEVRKEEDDETASTTTSGSSSSVASSELDETHHRVKEYLFIFVVVVLMIIVYGGAWLKNNEQSEEDKFWASRWKGWATDDDSVRAATGKHVYNPYTSLGPYTQQGLEEYYKNYKPQPSPKNLYQWNNDIDTKADRRDHTQTEAYDWQHGQGVPSYDDTINKSTGNKEKERNDGRHPLHKGKEDSKAGEDGLQPHVAARQKKQTRTKWIGVEYEEYYKNRKIVVPYEHFDESCRALELNLTIIAAVVDPSSSSHRRCPNTVSSLDMDEATRQLFWCCQLKDFYNMLRFDSTTEDHRRSCLRYQDDFGAALYKVDEYTGDRFYPWMEFMVQWQPQCPDQVIMRSMEQYC